jgi:hypothetical protein
VPSASAHRLIPDCRISVAGKKLDTAKDAALTRVDVDLDGDLFGQCVLTFNDPKMVLINGKDFKSGTAIKVEIGFHTKLKKVFEGEVVALEPVFRRDSPPSLKVVCQESLHRLALCQMTRAFNDVDDKEIATRIARPPAPRSTSSRATSPTRPSCAAWPRRPATPCASRARSSSSGPRPRAPTYRSIRATG